MVQDCYLYCTFKIHDFYSNKVLSSSYGREPKSMTKTCIFFFNGTYMDSNFYDGKFTIWGYFEKKKVDHFSPCKSSETFKLSNFILWKGEMHGVVGIPQ